MRYLLAGSVAALLLISGWHCGRKVDPFVLDMGYGYFPLDTGRYLVYAVDSVIYDDFNEIVDTVSFQMKEEYVSTDLDNSGRLYYRTERYERADDTSAWLFKNVSMTLVTSEWAEKTEGNQRYIKLRFPTLLENTFDPNLYLNVDTTYFLRNSIKIDIFKDWDTAKYVMINEPYTLGSLTFDSVLTVNLCNKENNIELRYAVERFAKGVGLIERVWRILDTQCIQPCLGQPWEQKAEKGFILRQRLIDHNFF